MQRQRETIRVSVRSLIQISECRDLGNIIQIQQQWLAHTVERITSDWSALAKDAVELTEVLTRRRYQRSSAQTLTEDAR